MQVGDLVRVTDDPSLRGLGLAPCRGLETALRRRAVLEDAVSCLPGEVEARAVLLELLDDAHALLVVAEALGQEAREHLFADVTERRVPDVVPERHRLD